MNALKGVLLTLVFTAALSVLAALLFRFPVPFAGMIGPYGDLTRVAPIEAVQAALQAWVTYSLLGGAVPQIVLGLALGVGLGGRFSDASKQNRAIALGAFIGALLMVLGLATLDWFIGPW